MKYVRSTAQFPDPVSVGARDWGEETLLATSSGNFTLKKLFINIDLRASVHSAIFQMELIRLTLKH